MKKPKKTEDIYVEDSFTVTSGLKKWVTTILMIIYLIGLFTFSLLPGEDVNETIISSNANLIHYFGYFFLVVVLFAFFFFNVQKYNISLTLGCGIAIAILTEVLQNFIPGRNCSFADLSINLVGLFTIPIFILIMAEIWSEREENYYD